MIKARNIYKYYGDLQVLKGVDLEVATAEVVSIVGASGAGKTTLLQILGSLDKASETEKNQTSILLDGVEISGMNDKAISKFRNENIGFIFQFHQLLPEFSALENVCMPAMIAGKSLKEATPRALELLSFFGLKDRATHKPQQLSGGEQQRVAVARALMNQPKVIFADEPSGNLDSKNAEELHQLFFDLRNEFGQTFVIVTHNKDLAEMADRKIVMKDGNLV
ncbi:ABC transporter ATP-binding protein [Ornithobacterium rhinotracheale]|uniref:ABC-type antimicrobial peptide transport system, ATPase component n=1 Tax=Ornithobacterium rhinotracheale (strain ATCC 51463 / DSM 15997 / CCUG 23171 / CIP 104009 / LMG 9086) TaxID=867902 RepID=I4A207_ORNRL|nr:ABC transporter ATP-binding protein [Ornithobacterium rhinotracheale]AFL97991.1 ABC-type antimicrobial peptide transport system, ATPase component [Ornithobacterium rhinotracheale DSM 15997]AIP99781.1 ABC transporter ATP-binding protein [Ornithobacterium rhinotracheale ORT-UMN 88]KGB65989.1 ABC transporter ATP-binding protein [Ornithobacterium rhinotracheale H06-030791]MCK0193717.1 ABC transporter ATP-binding protein [Ornithobacterium rhinotracheale]MCK0199345.1 ABC transporter ATP-binding p